MRKQLTLVRENTGKDPLPQFSFYALLFTWYEADIMAANIENLRQQGVDRIFIIDNDSPDDTREVAEAYGAEIISIYRSNNFNEQMKVRKVNEFTKKIVDEAPHDHVWVLHLDADELPTGPHGMTIRQYIETLDRQFRVVGSVWVNHDPNLSVQNIPGFHPEEFQPFAAYHGTEGVCDLTHDKHQLIRHDKQGPLIEVSGGYHWYNSNVLHAEPHDCIWNHHFKFREYDVTEQRLRVLNETRLAQRNAVAKRRTQNDEAECFWSDRFKKLRGFYDRHPSGHTWPELVNTPSIPKWYTEQELVDAVRAKVGPQGVLYWQAERALAYGEFDKALGHIEQYPFDGANMRHEETLKIEKAKCLTQLGRGAEARQYVVEVLQSGPSLDMIRQLKPLLR